MARYERPYNVTGIIKHIGLQDTPKGICKDRNIGTRKGQNALKGVYTLAVIGKRKKTITYFYLTESGGKTEEATIISCGGIATSQL